MNTALDRYKVARFGWSNRLQVPANKRKIEKTNLAPGGFDQFVTTVGDIAFAFGAPLPSGAASSYEHDHRTFSVSRRLKRSNSDFHSNRCLLSTTNIAPSSVSTTRPSAKRWCFHFTQPFELVFAQKRENYQRQSCCLVPVLPKK